MSLELYTATLCRWFCAGVITLAFAVFVLMLALGVAAILFPGILKTGADDGEGER